MTQAAVRNVYIDAYLAPLAPYLERPDVTDIYVNRPGEIWLETLSGAAIRIPAPELTSDLLARLVRQIAALSAQGVNREHPLLAASLPSGERVQAVIPPATRGDIALALRKHVVAGLDLDDYRRAGALDSTSVVTASEAERRRRSYGPGEDPVALLRSAVRDRRNILISGGTSSGKTTFLNTLLREIPAEERLLLIEDTPELRLSHDNAVGLIATRGVLGEAQVSTDDLLIAALRMRPDRIILGEIRGSEAVTYLRAINTGHPGSISTIHADDPLRAIDQLALLVMQTGTRMAWDDVLKYVRRSLDVIVQLTRIAGRRQISELMVVD